MYPYRTDAMTAHRNRRYALTAALEYHACGWVVVQIYPIGADGRCTCGSAKCLPTTAGKHPVGGKRRGALRTAAAIHRAYRLRPDAGVGILTGSGLVVIDVDPRHGGHVEPTADGYRVTRNGKFVCDPPPTMVQRTGGGGWHLLYAAPPGVRSRKLAGPEGAVDLLGEGGFIVAAPSPHYTGGTYKWIGLNTPAPLPPELLEPAPDQCETATGTAPPPANASPRSTGTVREAIEAIAAACLARNGTRCGDEINFQCPDPTHPDIHPSAYFNTIKRVWNCRACGAKGGYRNLAHLLCIDLPHPREHTRDLAQRWRERLAAQYLPGAQGITDKRVAEWILGDTLASGQRGRALSVRRVAVGVGIGEKTAYGSLRRWVARRMLRPVQPGIQPAEGIAGRWYYLRALP